MTLAFHATEELRQATADLKRYGVGWSPGMTVSGGRKATLVGDPTLEGAAYDHGPLSFWSIHYAGRTLDGYDDGGDSTASFGVALLAATKWILGYYAKRTETAAQTLVDSR